MMEYIGALGYGSMRCAVRVCGLGEEFEAAAKGFGRKVRRWMVDWQRRRGDWRRGRAAFETDMVR